MQRPVLHPRREVPPGDIERGLGILVAAERRESLGQRLARVDFRLDHRRGEPVAEHGERAGRPFAAAGGSIARRRLAPADRAAAGEFHEDGFQGFARTAGDDLGRLAGQGDVEQGEGVDVHGQGDQSYCWN